MILKKILGAFTAAAIAATALVIPASANDPTYEGSKGSFKANFINEWNENGVKENPVLSIETTPTSIKLTFKINGVPEGTFHAGLIFQTAEWYYRDTLDQDELKNPDQEDLDVPTTFVDATIEGDGEYTVEVKDLPENSFPWHSLGLLTDIPYEEGKITVEVVSVEGVTLVGGGNSGNEDPGTSDPGNDTPKDPVNTGVEGIAVFAGLAVLATGAVLISRKRK